MRKNTHVDPGIQLDYFPFRKNIQKVNIMSAEKASTYDILNSHTVLFQKTALKKLEETLG